MVPFASLFTHCDLSAHLISLLDSYYFTFANLTARAEALYLATKPVLDKEPRFRNGNDRALIEKYQVSSNSLSLSHFRSSFVSAFFRVGTCEIFNLIVVSFIVMFFRAFLAFYFSPAFILFCFFIRFNF